MPPPTTPSCFSTFRIVPKKRVQSKRKLRFWTYSPSRRVFTGISSSSRPLICAQPVRPGRISLEPFASENAQKMHRICEQMGGHVGRGTGIHRSEFWHSEGSFVDADPLLPEQHRSRRIQLDNQCEHQHGNRKDDQTRKRQNDIYHPLDYTPIHVCIPPQ